MKGLDEEPPCPHENGSFLTIGKAASLETLLAEVIPTKINICEEQVAIRLMRALRTRD